MKLKHRTYFILFSVFFVLLLTVQGYYVYNLWKLKEGELHKEISGKLKDLDNINSLNLVELSRDSELTKLISDYNIGKTSLKEIKYFFSQKEKIGQPKIQRYIDSLFANSDFKVGVHKFYSKIYYGKEHQLLFNNPMTIYQTQPPVNKGTIFYSGSYKTEYTSQSDEVTKDNYEIYIEAYSCSVYKIFNLNEILLRRLLPPILLSFMILVAVLVLFFLTIRNFERQTKAIAVLHDTVDTISHEFKTPVSTMKFATKLLHTQQPNDHTLLLNRQVLKLEYLLGRLHQDHSEHQPFSIENTQLFLNDFIATHPNIKMEYHIGSSFQLSLSQNEFEILLSNLLDNAIKYGGTYIKVIINKLSQNEVYISVKDNGRGISKDHQDNIFDKFYRVSEGNIHTTKGLGMGLYIVKQLVNQYHGEIEVHSHHKGTEFKIKFKNL
ncbi:sensor histidine kinase [Riemerella columbina]|uniref:sensor histidine kinase n=1 Tax=Riemerella columbina TaxID=103810 RepID=UPI000380996D|nr:HAMP domain-containing sensor histidine kinase [Riemerella columbina]